MFKMLMKILVLKDEEVEGVNMQHLAAGLTALDSQLSQMLMSGWISALHGVPRSARARAGSQRLRPEI